MMAALLSIVNEVMKSMDNRRAIYMVMLDLSATFDTIDNDVLIDSLNNTHDHVTTCH